VSGFDHWRPAPFLTNRHFLAKRTDLCFAFSEVSRVADREVQEQREMVFLQNSIAERPRFPRRPLSPAWMARLGAHKSCVFPFSAEASQVIENAHSAGENSSK
jgi:hypothetical protein